MPAQSKSQQRLFGMAYAAKKGELKSSNLGPEVQKLVDSLSKSKLKEFAKTKHEGLPNKKDSDEKDSKKPREKSGSVYSEIKDGKTNSLNLKQYKTASFIERFIARL